MKLNYLDAWTAGRQRNAATYRRLFADAGLVADAHPSSFTLHPSSFVTLPYDAGYGRHIYNQFAIRCERRDALMAHLKQRGIGTEIYYPVPLHLQECFAGLGHRAGDFPASEMAAQQTLALPIYPELTTEQQVVVTSAMREFHH